MKKFLLFGLACAFTFTGMAQNIKSFKNSAEDRTERRTDYSFKKTDSQFHPIAVNMKSTDGAEEIVRVEMGKSANIYSVLTSYQRCMAYDEPSNAILGTFRGDPATYPAALGSGTIMSFKSADAGMNWDWQITVNPDPDVHALRYPSGVIFNPDASSNHEDAYVVAAGPSHTAGTWDYTFYGAGQLNNSNFSDYYYTWESENDWARSSMTVVPGAVYNHGQDYTSVGNFGLDQTMKHYIGTTDDPVDGFEWEYTDVTPDWVVDEAEGNSVALYTNNAAWSRDGSIGYMWIVGVTENSVDYGGYQPAVYYTEDAGDSWDEIELDAEDHPTLVEFLPPWQDAGGNDGTVKPTMGISQTGSRNFPGVVDYEGRLHLFAPTFGSSTESPLDPESGYWTVGDIQGGHIFDFVLDPDGLIDIYFVDSIMAAEAPADAFGDVGWGARLQASKSLDEKVVFAVWTDDANSDDGTNINPDIKGWGMDTETGVMAEPVNFTQDDLYAGFYFFPYVAELSPKVDGFYHIPVSTSLTPAEFGAGDPLAAVTHNYVYGIGFSEETFIGFEEGPTAVSSIEVSQNQPNPFTGTTTIEISSKEVAPVMIEVSNIMGQTIYTMNAGTINGTKRVELNASDLESGVYFYTVTIGNESVSKKMIVE